jgi:hypothetical protein
MTGFREDWFGNWSAAQENEIRSRSVDWSPRDDFPS